MKKVRVTKYDVYSDGTPNTATSRTSEFVFKNEQDGRRCMKYCKTAIGVIKVEQKVE